MNVSEKSPLIIAQPQAYGFKEKLAEGERAEQFIASCLNVLGSVHPVSDMAFQRVGIDAFIVSERYGYTSVQFKQCRLAQRTGNAFIEVTMEDGNGTVTGKGWAYKTTANNIAYWAQGTGRIYIMDTLAVKRRLPFWEKRYPMRWGYSNENGKTWSAGGRCVPLSIIESEVCTDVLTVQESQ